MKNLLVIIIIVGLLGGGGLFGLIQFGLIPDPFADPESASGAGADGEGGEAEDPYADLRRRQAALVQLEDILLPVIQDGRVIKTVTLQLRIEVPWQGRSAMFDDAPRMRDIVFEAMLEHLPKNYAVRTRLRPREMKRDIDKALKKAYGDRVEGVVFQNIFEQ